MEAPFDPAWIVAEAPGYVVVDKPAGVATQPQAEGLADDLVSRLRAHLRARGEDDSLGVHQRLDRETSGLVVFSRGEGTRAIARAFEERRVTKEYVAGVFGDPGEARSLRHLLAGRSRGVVRTSPRGKEALTELRPLERRGGRALLSLCPRTGRTHQLRVQLAEIGHPIAGDALYGDRPAARMLLHAARLTVPLDGGEVLRFEAPLPDEFARFLAGEDGADLRDERAIEAAISRAILRRGALQYPPVGAPTTDAYRIFHRHGDGAPELAVDRYGDFIVLHAYEDEGPLELRPTLEVLARLGCRGIYLKRRRRTTHLPEEASPEELAPARPVWGEEAPAEIEIFEHGVSYPARLGDGLSTGIFLDQRENRLRLMHASEGRSVLNLFAYAGAFTVAAVEGGATHTLSIDASRVAIERARESVHRRAPAGDGRGEHRFLVEDVFELLPRLARRGERFDHVICDPPTHARTKKHRFNSGRDWISLAEACARLVGPGGSLWASTNDHRMDPSEFERVLQKGAQRAHREVLERRHFGPPLDFPHAPASPPHQKMVVLTLR